MPFENRTVMKQKLEFILLIKNNNKIRFKELCNRFKISRKTGYKWLNRFNKIGISGLENNSRRPIRSPLKCRKEIEDYVIKLRKDEPEWGPKKLKRILDNQHEKGYYPYEYVPCKNTIGKILKRNNLIDPEKSLKAKPFQKFEYDNPNDLWQIDFKGYFKMLNYELCYPLAILDDHSRFNIGLFACSNQKYLTVKTHLIEIFKRYGLPVKILTDNGSPWGTGGWETVDGIRSFTGLEKWLITLNIKLIHGRPYHPQTQGKEERFNRTLKLELLKYYHFRDLNHCQIHFDKWREKYNCIRPHESLNQDIPMDHYKPSKRNYPETTPVIEYDPACVVRKVMEGGLVAFKGKDFRVGKAFIGDYVGIKAVNNDEWSVYFCNQLIRNISLK
jgi:transposase InsO family protein